MRVIKPFALGYSQRAYTAKPKHFFAIAAYAGFDLLNPLPLKKDQDVFPIMMAALPGQILDYGIPKASGEVLLAGEARAPGGAPVESLEVGFRLGALEKRLRVSGQRIWQYHHDHFRFTRPHPFTTMPLGWESSYGGPNFPENPLGKGHGARDRVAARKPAELPNVEPVGRPVLQIDDVPMPAGFGPIRETWPQRKRLMGTYDAKWHDTLFPGFAADIDWRYFNAAPPDQRFEGFFKGDEPFVIAGCHEDQPMLRGRLPAIRVRAFVNQEVADRVALIEVGMRAETVYLFPNALTGVVLYRGALEVSDSDGKDIQELILAYEKLSDEPRPFDYYLDFHGKRTDPDTGWMYIFSETRLGPELTEDDRTAREAARIEEDRAAEILKTEKRDFVLELLAEEHGVAVPADLLEMEGEDDGLKTVIPMPTRDEIDRLDIDLPGIMAAADQLRTEASAKIDDLMEMATAERAKAEASLESKRDEIEDLIGQPLTADPDTLAKQRAQIRAYALDGALRFGLEEALEPEAVIQAMETATAEMGSATPPAATGGRLSEADKENLEGLDKIPFDIDGFLDELTARAPKPDGPVWSEDKSAEHRATMSGMRDELRDAMRQMRLLALKPLAPEDPLDPVVARELGVLILEELAAGRSLAGADLAGADLAGADLSGADLSGTYLEAADLTGATLAGATLAGAVLAGAVLTDANLTGADLAGANLAAIEAERAIFTAADLTDCMLIDAALAGADLSDTALGAANLLNADLTGARLERSTAEKAKLIRAKLDHVSAKGVRWTKVVVIEATAEGADFSDGVLNKLILLKTEAPGLILDRARLQGLAAIASSFPGLSAIGARNEADGTGFRGCDLAGADFRNAVLGMIELSEATLSDANFAGASLRSALLFGANLERADFTAADLADAKLRKANCRYTNFRNANLFQAEVIEAGFGDTIVEGANIRGTRLVPQSTF